MSCAEAKKGGQMLTQSGSEQSRERFECRGLQNGRKKSPFDGAHSRIWASLQLGW